ncbi:TlyA family rRNA (cytidine-2'-O)-methyltransferase [Arcobacter sp. 31_11_sub10_T18]|nr:TlyA family rRNA (cytidine-2'-O)-methyltransferase [Arcobacter sp. 31_11_sub10_T18]
MRLDIYLAKHFNIQSRNKAHELIKSNKVQINSKIVSKPSYQVEENDNIILLEDDFYVSRAAYKLKFFLEEINLNLENKEALDIGSSTGGFTQILLNNHVKNVTCVDVGSNQLHSSLRDNQRITFHEKCDIRNFSTKNSFELVTCDVSFISIHHIINSIDVLANDIIIILFKPQFEVGVNIKRDKKGVVLDKIAIEKARITFLETTKNLHWNLVSSAISKLQGKDGNNEELFYFKK